MHQDSGSIDGPAESAGGFRFEPRCGEAYDVLGRDGYINRKSRRPHRRVFGRDSILASGQKTNVLVGVRTIVRARR
jgi:hypothetical protein